jgi:serine protease Do
MIQSSQIKNQKKLIRTSLISIGLSLSLILSMTPQPAMASDGTSSAPISKEEVAPGLALQNVFVTVSKAVIPSVVNISTTSVVTAKPQNPFMNDPFFRQFFGNQAPGGAPQKHVERSLGSGFIISKDGYIVTNYHVVKHATKVTVVLSDKSSYRATIIGKDPMTDVAVIRIHPKHDLPIVSWGDSKKVSVGTIVLAMGSPFGLTQSITMGIVSALKRSNIGIEQYENFIQTDAAINPGNSGGPLVNLFGQVIGMNTAIYTTNGGYEGIGFAIPAEMVRQVVNDLRTKGRVVRGWLGVSIQNISPVIERQFHLSSKKGVLVSDILPDGPASHAGFKRGDVIIALDDHEIQDANDLRFRVSRIAPGTNVRITVIRNGDKRNIPVMIGELPANIAMAGNHVEKPSSPKLNNVLKGLVITDITAEMRQQLNLPAHLEGVIVEGVASGSVAESAGLRRGDIIVEVNRHSVHSVSEYIRIAKKIKKDQDAVLSVLRDGRYSYVPLSP